MDESPSYRPKHHHIERRAGSSTGGLSQIDFAFAAAPPERENMPPDVMTRMGKRGTGAAEFAARNATSSVFSFLDGPESSAPVPPPRHIYPHQAAQASTLQLAYDLEAPLPAPPSFLDATPRQPRSNPILGGAFDTYDAAVPVTERASDSRPTTAQRSVRDPNRSSIVGGIFGDGLPAAQPTARRHRAIEETPTAQYGSKRVVNGRMEYCA
eukprot:CAMPEP_0119431030 /NCGR_PEP_ID=MMETSP1335-20130426/45166_1 /TAXON_ID=259385 /ORGANISM="Chrysoculter rhomboideus, Strain RCC1486" /LENGTH=210 /DNA_ID=CAMNT_0007456813 /DNA_START=34 /DNA_END=666 /DNA_ORIENTATION=+